MKKLQRKCVPTFQRSNRNEFRYSYNNNNQYVNNNIYMLELHFSVGTNSVLLELQFFKKNSVGTLETPSNRIKIANKTDFQQVENLVGLLERWNEKNDF